METLETTIILRKAKMWDVFYNGFEKRLGQPFWLKSMNSGKFDNKAYLVEKSTSAKELKQWVDCDMLFVPASDLEIKDFQKTMSKEQLTISA